MTIIRRKGRLAVFSKPQDERTPLELAAAIADRFMRISPQPDTYMYHLGLVALLDLWEATQEQRYLDFYLAAGGAKSTPRFDWRLYLITGDRRWLTGLEDAARALLESPRRDREGSLLDPRGRYTVDCLAGYFQMLIVHGHLLGDGRYFDDALRQLEIHRSYLEDPATGLWYSRFGHSMHPKRCNPGLWSRGNGWLVAGWGRTAHLWAPGHPRRAEMLDAWQRYARSVAAFQTESGLFRQLLNRPGSFEEATGSALFCTGLALGVCHGTLPAAEFGPAAHRAFCGLRALIDGNGNIHNVSTYAGGYNFERQYDTCARLNEPHGDGSVMSACVAVHRLLEHLPAAARTPPDRAPEIVTDHEPRLLSNESPRKRDPRAVAEPVLARILALDAIPANDLFGTTVVGLLDWHARAGDPAALAKARALAPLYPAERPWAVLRVGMETALQAGPAAGHDGWLVALERALAALRRDRDGVFLDPAGGYSPEHLHALLPLLAGAARATGRRGFLDEACRQLLGYRAWLEDPLSRLWHSAFGHGAHPRRVTPGLWALGNAYGAAATAALLENLPADHPGYLDAVSLFRRHAEACHEYLPVWGGWSQLMEEPGLFPCTAATALLTASFARGLSRGWLPANMHALVWGGVYGLSRLCAPDGRLGASSRPLCGPDSAAGYEAHAEPDDPAALGYVLSACAAASDPAVPGNPDDDGTLGAR